MGEGLAFLLERLPSRVHVVVSTRADRGLPLSRIWVLRELLEIGAVDLSHSTDAAAAYPQSVFGLHLAADVAVFGGAHEGVGRSALDDLAHAPGADNGSHLCMTPGRANLFIVVRTCTSGGGPVALSIRLTPEDEARLEALARRTGRSKTFYVREAIHQHLGDLEEQFWAAPALRSRSWKRGLSNPRSFGQGTLGQARALACPHNPVAKAHSGICYPR